MKSDAENWRLGHASGMVGQGDPLILIRLKSHSLV